jgi:hypothetical protein
MKFRLSLVLVALVAAAPCQAFNVYFANLHSHTAYSDGIGTPAEAFTYARDVADIDVLGVTDHTHLIGASEWIHLLSTADSFCEDGVFVALGAQEFGNLNDFGHLAIYDCPYENPYATENLLGSYQFVQTNNAITGFNHPNPEYGTNFNDLAYYPEYVDEVISIEIRNGQRVDNYETQYIQALRNGWHVGPFANQDNHEGHWGDQGNPNSGGQIYLTGILADALTKTDILEALRTRRFFACEVDPPSDRMELEFYANGQVMGSSIVSSAHLALTGTARALNGSSLFNRVDLFEDGVLIRTHQQIGTNISWTFDEALLDGENHFYFVRATQVDGDHAWSSPIRVVAQVDPAESEAAVLEGGFSIELIGPHPSGATTLFSIHLSEGARGRPASIDVFDTLGRRVGGMPSRSLDPGFHTWSWEGSGDGGTAGAGVYFARLAIDGKPVACRRLVRIP